MHAISALRIDSPEHCEEASLNQLLFSSARVYAVLAIAGALISTSASAQPLKRSASGASGFEQPVRQLIVKFRADSLQTFSAASGRARASGLAQKSGMAIAYRRPMSGLSHVYSLAQPMSQVEAYALAKRLELSDPSIEFAEPDSIHRALVVPNDPTYAASQWHYKAPDAANSLLGGINAPLAWDVSRGQGIIVAVLDTGIVLHPDLAANVIQGYDFISDSFISNDGDGRDANPSDPGDYAPANYCALGDPAGNSSWHGTHVSGTIAAITNNGIGVAGVAYEARVLNVRVLGRCGGTTSDIADAMRWAAGLAVPGVPNNTNVAKVINLSLGALIACSATFQSAVSAVTTAGALVVAATGNEFQGNQVGSPANCAGALAVTAHTLQGDKADYANIGPGTALSAPGGGSCATPDSGAFICLTRSNVTNKWVWSTVDLGATVRTASSYLGTAWQGTSMATPHVSGVAALLFSRMAGLSVDEAKFLLTSSTRAFPANTLCPTFMDGRCGTGMLDARAALDRQTGRIPTLAVVAPTATAGGQPVLLGITAAPRNGGSPAFVYTWIQTGGPPVSLLNADTANASFVATNPGGTHTFQATVIDGNGYSVSHTVTTRSNNVATVNPVVAQSVEVGSALQFKVSASDPEQDQLTLIASGLPPGSVFDAATGDFIWANPAPAGDYAFTVVANDGTVNSACDNRQHRCDGLGTVGQQRVGGGGGSISWRLTCALLLLLSLTKLARGRVLNGDT